MAHVPANGWPIDSDVKAKPLGVGVATSHNSVPTMSEMVQGPVFPKPGGPAKSATPA